MIVRDLLIRLGFKLEDDKLDKVDRLLKDVKGSAGDAQRGANDLGRSIKGALLGAAVTGGLALFGRELIKVTANTQKLAAQLETIEGSAAVAERAFVMLKKFARDTPFELGNVVAAYSRLRAVGLKPTMDDLTAFGDIAAGMGGDIQEFGEAVVAATTGEMEQLKKFGIVASQQGKKVTFTFKGQKTTIKKEAGAIMGFLSTLGKENFAGGMSRQMNTIGGAFSNLKDNLSAFFNEIGKAGFNQALTDLIREMTGMVGEGESAAYTIGKLLTGALKTARGALKFVKENIGAVTKALGAMVAIAMLVALGKFAIAIGGITTATVALKVASVKAAAAQALIGLKALLVVAAFALMLLAFEDIYGFFNGDESVIGIWLEDMGLKGKEATDALKNGLLAIVGVLLIVLAVLNLPLSLLLALAAAVVVLYTEAENIIPAFKNAGNEIWSFFKKLSILIYNEIASWVVSLGTAIGEAAAYLWTPIMSSFDNAILWLRSKWDGVVDYITAKVRDLIGIATRAADVLSDPIKLGEQLLSGESSVGDITAKVFGTGASSPTLDTQRRVAQIKGAQGGPRFSIAAPITVTQTGAAIGEAATEIEAQMRKMFDKVVSDAASDLEGGLD